MSLIVFATTSEGIVLAGDSRQSYINRRGMIRIGSDNVFKIFKLNDRVGLGITGLGFMAENNVNKSMSKFIDEFKIEVDIKNKGITETSYLLYEWFLKKYDLDSKVENLKAKLEVDFKLQGSTIIEMKRNKTELSVKYIDFDKKEKEKKYPFPKDLNFMTTGYNGDNSYELYSISIPGEIE